MTVFNTPLLTPLLRLLVLLIAKLIGWNFPQEEADKHRREIQKCVFIGAPHTSNWDFPLMLMAVLAMRLQVNWIGKHTLFSGPLGPVMRYLGGIPINRGQTTNFVDAVVEQFNAQEQMMLVIAPEGTRKLVEKWRSGFYFMAHLSQVPIIMSYIDYQKKELGIFEIFKTTGDVDKDIAWMQRVYANYVGKNPGNYHRPPSPQD